MYLVLNGLNPTCRVYLLEPVSDSHHDVKRSEEEDEVKKRIAVDRAFLLIIYYCLPSVFIIHFIITCTE